MRLPIWLDAVPLMQEDSLEDRPQITPYIVHKESSTAGMIVLPGGGYSYRASHEGAPIAQWLNGLGISLAVGIKPHGYTVLPD